MAILRIIADSLKIALRPPLREDELVVTAMAWQPLLEGIIPLEKLEDAFRASVAFHIGNYPINAHDLINAYRDRTPERSEDEVKMREAVLESQRLFYGRRNS